MRVLHDLADLAQVAFRRVVVGVHVHLGRAEAVFRNLAEVQVEIVDVEFREFRFERGGGQSGVDRARRAACRRWPPRCSRYRRFS